MSSNAVKRMKLGDQYGEKNMSSRDASNHKSSKITYSIDFSIAFDLQKNDGFKNPEGTLRKK